MIVTPGSFENSSGDKANPTEDILEAMKIVSMRKTKNYF